MFFYHIHIFIIVVKNNTCGGFFMNYVKYARSFIILDDKKSDFRNTNDSIKGHIKVEYRNNQATIRCIAQNLKYYEDARYLYKLYLFGKKDNQTVFTNAGTLFIDKHGKGEHIFRFNPLNVDGEGHELFDFNIAAIIAQPNKDVIDDDNIYPVLTGYISKEAKNASVSEENITHIGEKIQTDKVELSKEAEVEEIEKDEQSESEIHTEQDMPITEELTEEVITDEEVPQEENLQEEIIEESNTYHSHHIEAASHGPLSSPSSNEVKISKKACDTNSYYSNYVRAVSTNLENVLSYYNKSQPFDNDPLDCRWWKVMNLMSIPFVNTSYLQGYPEHMRPYQMNYNNTNPKQTYPSCHDLIYKYQHYIFGVEKDENDVTSYYYYGIPGRYMKEEQPDNGTSGFQYWQPLQGVEKRKGDYGYWIIAVNAKTGQLEIPQE